MSAGARGGGGDMGVRGARGVRAHRGVHCPVQASRVGVGLVVAAGRARTCGFVRGSQPSHGRARAVSRIEAVCSDVVLGCACRRERGVCVLWPSG
eukprot:scaffold3416_cov133-Isochrysis_galbana.AAC.6